MKTMMKWMLGTITLATLGCGTPTDKEKPDTFRNVTLELRNTGTASVWVGQQFPLKILVGTDAYVPLDGCSSGGERASDAAPAESRSEIRPGSAWTHVWNGAVIRNGDCPDLRDHLGEELIAEFCFGKNIDGADEWSGGITDIECVRTPFTLGEDTTVVAEINHNVELDDSIPVILENNTAEPLFAQIADNCGSSTFFSVKFGEETIELGSICGPCDCSEGGECFVACDAACQAPQVAEIAPGATVEGSFSLAYRKLYNEATYECTQLHPVPAGTLTATICYGTEALDEFEINEGVIFGTVVDPICEDVEFTIADDEIRLVVTGPVASL